MTTATEMLEWEQALRVRGVEVELRHWLCRRVALPDRPVAVVPGHGGAADAEGISAQRSYFERLYEAVGDARLAGRSRAEAVRVVPPGMPAERAELLGANLGLVFDELEQKTAAREEFSCQPE